MKFYASLRTALPLMLMVAVPASSYAADYPARAIRLIVSQQAGGGTDNLARMWAENVGKTLNVPVVVENRPGAGGSIAVSATLAQPADGYTLFMAGVSQMVLNKFVYKPLAYSPEKDFDGVAMLTTVPFVLVASPKSSIDSYEALKKAAAANPEKVTFASSGNGNSTHLVIEMLMKQAGFKMLHIPFRGEPDGVMATVGGTTEIMAPVLSTALPLIKEGKLKPLLVFNSSRVPELPDVRTAAEVGVSGLENIGWSGIAAKKGTPPEAIAKLNAATQKFLQDPAVKEKLAATQAIPMPSAPADLMKYTAQDTAKWQQAIGDLKLTVN